MKNVVCIKHPKYDPTQPPELSCRVCCERYVDRIKQTQDYFRNHQSHQRRDHECHQSALANGTFDRRRGNR